MKTKFKVGDTVRLKKNLKVGKVYDEFELFPSMKFEGSKVIREVFYQDNIAFSVMFESWPYYYSIAMLTKEKP